MKSCRAALIAIVLGLLLQAVLHPSVVDAASWFVAEGGAGHGTRTNPFGRLQDALGVAEPGDVIALEPGTYEESVRTVRGGYSDGTDHRACRRSFPRSTGSSDRPRDGAAGGSPLHCGRRHRGRRAIRARTHTGHPGRCRLLRPPERRGATVRPRLRPNQSDPRRTHRRLRDSPLSEQHRGAS